MHKMSHHGNSSIGHRDRSRMAILGGVAALTLVSSAWAQYIFNPANADEQGNGIRYFGSAKDDNGALLRGVTILLDTTELSYTAITDEQGRFHVLLPLAGWGADRVSPTCFKQGFEAVRVTKRPGMGPRPTVQIDCVLRRKKTD
jgi:hypothetical protein